MSDKLVNPHDAFFKHYLSQPAVASDFLRHHLPAEVVALLDLQHLRLEKDSFVDEKLRSYFSDLIYTAMTHDANPVAVALLAEHKSYPDDWVDFQVLRYKVGYWVREFEAIEAEVEKQRAEAKSAAEAGLPPPLRTKARTTLTPILVILVYHGKDEWQIPLRFARHLTGMEDPASPLSQVMGRYVPDFEPHFVNVSAMTDDAIRGEVKTRLMLTVLKYIFDDRLDGRLGEILAMASEVLRQPSGIEMVMALLRYITRSAVKLNRTEITQQLLAYLPKEGGFLMETLAQEWIEEGKTIGFDLGKKEGIDIGKKEGLAQGMVTAQRQTLLHLLQWRFPLAPAAQQTYAQQVARIDNLDHLLQLVNQLLTSQEITDFDQALLSYLPPEPGKP
ncbi:MAG: Rpn family recombination-promoting nuclease/putative transposase [Caldilineaceae bacterium]